MGHTLDVVHGVAIDHKHVRDVSSVKSSPLVVVGAIANKRPDLSLSDPQIGSAPLQDL